MTSRRKGELLILLVVRWRQWLWHAIVRYVCRILTVSLHRQQNRLHQVAYMYPQLLQCEKSHRKTVPFSLHIFVRFYSCLILPNCKVSCILCRLVLSAACLIRFRILTLLGLPLVSSSIWRHWRVFWSIRKAIVFSFFIVFPFNHWSSTYYNSECVSNVWKSYAACSDFLTTTSGRSDEMSSHC